MSRTYQATGINLKSTPFGESDRMVTVLTKELGLIKAIAPGARKHNSSLGGRSGMFVVNELLIAKGKSLDKITQAHTIKTYPGLSQDLGKLAASQYLAEIVLTQALSEQPQIEIYELLTEHLQRLETLPNGAIYSVLAHLAHAVFHLLALAGVTPQVQACCLTQLPLTPDREDPNWQAGFSIPTGGVINLTAWERLRQQKVKQTQKKLETTATSPTVKETQNSTYQTIIHQQDIPTLSVRLNAVELDILQQLSQPEIKLLKPSFNNNWLSVEQILRSYTQYHLGHQIRSAALIDTYIASMPTAYINHDATV